MSDTPVRVLIADSLSPAAADMLRAAGGFDVHDRAGISPDELLTEIAETEVLLVRSRTKVTKAVLEAGAKLKIVGRAGIGVDNIDVAEATRAGVIVMNAPNGNSTTTAELAIAHLFALARHLVNATVSMRAGKWEKKRFSGTEVTGSVLGLVGIGNIGRIVADRAQGLRMRVKAYDPFVTPEKLREMGVEPVADLGELFAGADFISVHTPLTEKTRYLVGADEIGRMKPTAYLINCARGGVVDEAALVDALERNAIAGAALDVFESEPPGENPLLGSDKVHLTPHIGASTSQAQEKVARELVEQVIDYFVRNVVRNAINLPRVKDAEQEVLWPYVELGHKLGSFAAQYAGGPLTEVVVGYAGSIFQAGSVAMITNAILKGVLESDLDVPVNLVSAPVMIADRGIKVTEEIKGADADFTRLVTVELRGGPIPHRVEGTLLGSDDARIVRVDGYLVEAQPSGNLLVMRNDDVPGIIGRVGTLLGASDVNVSRMQVALPAAGGRQALAVWSTDQPVSAADLAAIREVEHVHACQQIRL